MGKGCHIWHSVIISILYAWPLKEVHLTCKADEKSRYPESARSSETDQVDMDIDVSACSIDCCQYLSGLTTNRT
jgi:putative ubiquitin-RnfH superfamily antitoxin RatB of RatAB toxin-antitoxin module